jgi:hypothetical protein
MGKIYVGQTDLTIKLETGKNLTDITTGSFAIKYRKPNGVIASFDATATDLVKGIIQYSVQNETDLDIPGDWTFWAKITDNQGLISIGEPFFVLVYKQGN